MSTFPTYKNASDQDIIKEFVMWEQNLYNTAYLMLDFGATQILHWLLLMFQII